MSSSSVAPPSRLSRARTFSVFVPSRTLVSFPPFPSRAALGFEVAWRGVLGAFWAGLAFFATLVLVGVTWARRGATRAFLLDFGWLPVAVAGAAVFSSVVIFILL